MRLSLLFVLPILSLLFASFSCADIGADNSGSVVIFTDMATYGLARTITFTVRNWGESTAYIWHCNHRLGYGIEKEANGDWLRVGDRYMLCLAVYPAGAEQVPVGYLYTDTLTLPTAGTYRLAMGVGWDREKFGQYMIYSNTFKVE